MSELSPPKKQILRQVMDAAPDRVLRSLTQALSSAAAYDPALAEVRAIVESEIQDRRVRNAVLCSVAPICRPPAEGRIGLPQQAIAQLWKALRRDRHGEVEEAAALLSEWREDDGPALVFDRLCAYAADALESGDNPSFQAVAATCERARPGLTTSLITCLRLSPIARRSIVRLPDWIGRMTSDKAAELRLAYRDVCAIAPDAGPVYFDILAAQLPEPWHILRIVSGVMDRPAEAYLSGSELGPIGESLLDTIDTALAAVSAFGAGGTPLEAKQTARAIERAVHQIGELEATVTLNPVGLWGKRAAAQKKGLALKVEAHLRSLEDLIAKALPLQTIRLGPRTLKGVPRLSSDPEPLLVARAHTLLVFCHEVRNSASMGGFGSTRAKVLEAINERMDQYVEDLLDHLRAELESDAEDTHDRARAYLDVVADFSALSKDEKAAQIVRRRAAAA